MTKKSNHILGELFPILKKSVSPDSYVQNVGNYYKEILPDSSFVIVTPEFSWNILKTVFFHGDCNSLLTQLKSIIKSSDPLTVLEKKNVFSLNNDQNQPDYLFYFGPDTLQIPDQIKDEFEIYNTYYRVISNCFNQG